MYIEIDNELINLSQITKIKKAKVGNNVYSIILEELGKPIKTIKYNNQDDMLVFYNSIKNKVLNTNEILEYKLIEKELMSSLTSRL
jgi:hypothetical protein